MDELFNYYIKTMLELVEEVPGWLSRLSIQLLILLISAQVSQFMGSSPVLGSALAAQSLLGILFPSLSAPPRFMLSQNK